MIPEHWHEATRHEDKLQTGIADVSFVDKMTGHGWCELKHLHRWPARASTRVSLPHFTPAQRVWLQSKGIAGNVFLLLQVADDHLLFRHDQLADLGFLTRAETESTACAVWRGRLDYADLARALRLNQHPE
jgi:hypothetical protein